LRIIVKSIRILTTYRILNITNIETTTSFIRAKGDDFSTTKFVVVNGQTTTDFALSGSSILIYPPEGIATNEVTFIAVIAESSDYDDHTLMKLGFGYDVREVSGVDRLVQLFVFVLLKSPGSYILDKYSGGGLMEIMRKGAGTQPDKVLPDVIAAIRKTESDIKAMQAGLKPPASELLLSVEILNTSIRSSDSSISVFVQLVTLDGSLKAFNISI